MSTAVVTASDLLEIFGGEFGERGKDVERSGGGALCRDAAQSWVWRWGNVVGFSEGRGT